MADSASHHANDIRRRVNGWRAAERREAEVRAAEGPLTPAASLAAADDLYSFCQHLLGGPDAVRAREVAQVRATWQTLRRRFGVPSLR